MSIETYLIYLGVLAAFFATPPDTSQLLIISNSLRHGLRRSLATVAGDLSANAVQMTLAAFGLTAVIETLDGAISYWALAHPAEKPDFHHPDSFILILPETSA